MPYINTAQLAQRLGTTLYARLTDRVNGTTADDTIGQQIVDQAAAEADSYLSRRYATPVDLDAHPELSALLTLRVLDLAEYAAWKASPFVSDPPHRVHTLYANALRWLEDVAEGRIVLPAAAPPCGPTAYDQGPHYQTGGRVFTASDLNGL